MNRSLVFALVAGIAGLILGRFLPQGTPSHTPGRAAVSASPTRAPFDCNTERTQLASVRAQLGICLAFQARDTELEPERSVVSEPDPPPTDPPPTDPPPTDPPPTVPTAAVPPEHARVLAMLAATPYRPVELVIVRHTDGTVRGYPANDWPADSDDGQVIGRTAPGRLGYYETDAGLVGLSDLAGTDGVIKMGVMTYRFLKPDAGAP